MLGDARRADHAEALLALRAGRRETFPSDLFAEHGWSMLLATFVALARNETIGRERLCAAADVPRMIGERWLSYLMGRDLLELHDDEDIALTGAATGAVRDYLDRSMGLRDGVAARPDGRLGC